MLPRGQKLSRTTFPDNRDRMLSWSGKALHVSVYAGDETVASPRFAVVVAKKKSVSAVSRNRFKRAVMAALRAHMIRFEHFPHRKYVIYPKEHIRTIAREDITEDIRDFSEKQGRK